MDDANALRFKEFCQFKKEIRGSTEYLIVGLDIAKEKHNAFFGTATGRTLHKGLVFDNTCEGFHKLLAQVELLRVQHSLQKVVFGLEPTANYHKPLAEHLNRCGQMVVLVAPSATMRNRELVDGRWDKHDIKDSANVADLVAQGKCLYYECPRMELRIYIVKDKLIYGELFSLMPLESDWCRGYMMFQTDEKNMLAIIRARKTQLAPKEANFRDVNNLLSEIANIAWGGFKSRFFKEGVPQQVDYRMQVPIIINHGQRFISFGSDNPQLCLQFRLRDKDGKLAESVLYQKFIFSLHWSPEKFAENQKAVTNLLDRGELEPF